MSPFGAPATWSARLSAAAFAGPPSPASWSFDGPMPARGSTIALPGPSPPGVAADADAEAGAWLSAGADAGADAGWLGAPCVGLTTATDAPGVAPAPGEVDAWPPDPCPRNRNAPPATATRTTRPTTIGMIAGPPRLA